MKTLEKISKWGSIPIDHIENGWGVPAGDQMEYICVQHLKQVAIEWIKEFEKDGVKESPKDEFLDFADIDGDHGFQGFNQVICWIKHFFGITEEDLK